MIKMKTARIFTGKNMIGDSGRSMAFSGDFDLMEIGH
jgi:hypothetical protein